MSRFSQRIGINKIKEVQREGMDEALRTGLWNVFFNDFWIRTGAFAPSFLIHVYKEFLNVPLDDGIRAGEHGKILRSLFFDFDWYVVYDFLEFTVEVQSEGPNYTFFQEQCNKVLTREQAAYRFLDGLITPITSESEINSIYETINNTEHLAPVRTHLKDALRKLSDRSQPDYRNSIKESISAVEALCKIISKDDSATLGEALKKIKKDDKVKIHGALNGALSQLYGYTSDANGIRHSLLEDSDLDFEDAQFMLVSCSAFINYLLVKSAKSGIQL
ncbi:AbiJ-NTD4 domain-containing protein [Paenibacillus sp. Root444D2]|uniref:AbiJ-NTD4 domain-containing protein n=1 Tax=Paenibacillus sp. Root444D2 TaxID=1736538 RepID=UPI00070CBFA0|nr:hypothetical protein [Paenibacillus sp. Root444D2]KQX45864.1 hypothetical protein ASD40_18685 [Paenibacillus sp. Root444D2]